MNLTVKPAVQGLSWRHDTFPKRLEPNQTIEIDLALSIQELLEGEREDFMGKGISSLLLLHYLGPMPGFSDIPGQPAFACMALTDAGTISGYIYNGDLDIILNPRAEPFIPTDFHDVLAMKLRDEELDPSLYRRTRAKGLPVATMPKGRLSDIIANHDRLQKQALSTLDRAQVEMCLPKHFLKLLALEEGQHHRDVAKYAIPNADVQLNRRDGVDYAILKVPGLSESCPLINLGDCVRLRSFTYTGGHVLSPTSQVCRVQSHSGENSLVLRMPTSASPRPKGKLVWTAEFQHDTVQFAVMRQACEEAILQHLLYPTAFFEVREPRLHYTHLVSCVAEQPVAMLRVSTE